MRKVWVGEHMRLGLDWDNMTKTKFKRKFGLIKIMFPNYRVQKERSAGGKGFHVIVYGLPKDFEEHFNIREWLGDDERRLRMDKLRHRDGVAINVLYTHKKGNDVVRL